MSRKLKKVSTVILLCLFGCVLDLGGFPESWAQDRPCRVEERTFFSRARQKDTSYYAFIPLATGGQKLPVLYLLHGAWDDYRVWKNKTGGDICRLAALHGIMIVTPDGDPFGWYADSPRIQSGQIETYLLKELIPHVESICPLASDRRSIAGLSMGGHGAVVLSLRNPGLFQSAGSMSGILDIRRHPGQWHLDEVFGPLEDENRNVWQTHSGLGLLEDHPQRARRIPMKIDVSLGDKWALKDNRLFHGKLNELKIDHQYTESAGEHDWKYWKSRLPGQIAFHAGILNQGTGKPGKSK